MKRVIFTLSFLITLILVHTGAVGQRTYTIPTSGNWSAWLPSTCANCTIDISSGVTLTLDQSYTCQNCVFQGGNLLINNKTLNIQFTGSQTTTFFKGTNVAVDGTNGQMIVNAPLSLSSSNFVFNNGATLTTSYEDDLTASTITLNDNSSMKSTGGANTLIDLVNSSRIVVGSGSQTSSAIFTVSGPTLTLYDNSTVTVGSDNNVYYNWSAYDYLPNTNANSAATKSYNTSTLALNCGSNYPHNCSNPSLYGPISLTSKGAVTVSTLPLVLGDFAAVLNSDKKVSLTWDTRQEENFSHFSIQRSADGQNWTEIGTVAAKGNSTSQTAYAFTDAQPLAGMGYYRLRMIDLDNSAQYSTVLLIRLSVVGTIGFFPNPARDYVNVSLGERSGILVTVRLINTTGQVMQEKRAETGAGVILSFPLQNCPAGVYFLSVITPDGLQESRQILVNRS